MTLVDKDGRPLEQVLQFVIGTQNGKIALKFSRAVSLIEFPPDMGREIAKVILLQADTLDPPKPIEETKEGA